MSAPGDERSQERTGLNTMSGRVRSVVRRKDGSKRLSWGRGSSSVAPTSSAGPLTATPAEAPRPVDASVPRAPAGSNAASFPPAPRVTASRTAPRAESIPPPATLPASSHAPLPVIIPTMPPPSTARAHEGPSPAEHKPGRILLRPQVIAERAETRDQRCPAPAPDLVVDDVLDSDSDVARLDRPPRVRRHRTCHRCQTSLGARKICVACHHTRCARCPSHPEDKIQSERTHHPSSSRPQPDDCIGPESYWGLREPFVLARPRQTGGQPLIKKKATQRVRRTCHCCLTLFQNGSRICAACQHVRCADCPRDPAKKRKFPDGYPGDAYSTTSTLPQKFTCHECMKPFPPIPHPDSPERLAAAASQPPPQCVRCGHEQCHRCPRAPIRKMEPPPDPEVLARILARLSEATMLNPGGAVAVGGAEQG